MNLLRTVWQRAETRAISRREVVEYANAHKALIEVKYQEQVPISDDDAIVELSRKAISAFRVYARIKLCKLSETFLVVGRVCV